MRTHFQEQLRELNQEILKMGTLVEESINKGLRSLANQDQDLAKQVIDEDEAVNAMELQVEDLCTVLIAKEQPVAGDLRHIVTCLKVVTQLERIGDHAVHLAKTTLKIGAEKLVKPLLSIPQMAEIGVSMLHDTMTAFVEGDVDKAVEVSRRDNEIDDLYNQVMRELLTYMMEKPQVISQAILLLFAARHLERLGDHVTNINEWIVYERTGKHSELNM